MNQQNNGLKEHWKNKSQSIFRTIKAENPFVQIDRRIYDDTRLSLRAMGLLGALLSKPSDWVISVSYLTNHFKEGKAAINSTINELIQYGYMVRITHRNSKGWVEYFEYLVFEDPNLSVEFNKESEKPQNQSSEQVSENQKVDCQEEDRQEIEKSPLLISDLKLKNDLTNNPPSFSPKSTDKGGDKKINLSMLEPIALKLFQQSNDEILENLWSEIKEFKLSMEVVNECLEQIDASEIRLNPYAYFRGKYLVSTTAVAKRNQALEENRRYKEYLKEQYTSIPIDTTCKSPEEYISDIKKRLGIIKNIDSAKQHNNLR